MRNNSQSSRFLAQCTTCVQAVHDECLSLQLATAREPRTHFLLNLAELCTRSAHLLAQLYAHNFALFPSVKSFFYPSSTGLTITTTN